MSIMCMPALVCLFRYTSCLYQRRRLYILLSISPVRSVTCGIIANTALLGPNCSSIATNGPIALGYTMQSLQ